MPEHQKATVLVAVGIAFAMSACDTPGSDDPLAADKRALLESVSTRVIAPTFALVVEKTDALVMACDAYALTPDAAHRETAQGAWRQAMVAWQRAELMQLGPAGRMGEVVGGQDLRDGIYSWPTTSTCRVDQETVEGAFEDESAFAEELVNVRGLDAMEYLLFVPDSGNSCSAGSPLNTGGDWAALSEEEIAAARAAYAKTLAHLVHGDALALQSAWNDAFAADFAAAGTEGSSFETAHAGLNALTDAMFYAEVDTKDAKVAKPAGYQDCGEDDCLALRESALSEQSLRHVHANIEAFESLYLGAPRGEEAPGIDDLLVAAGRPEVATDLDEHLRTASMRFEALMANLPEELEARPTEVRAAYDSLAEAMSIFKSEVAIALELELPVRAAGDND